MPKYPPIAHWEINEFVINLAKHFYSIYPIVFPNAIANLIWRATRVRSGSSRWRWLMVEFIYVYYR